MSGTASKDNTRAEEFKRATAGVLRAIAEQADVTHIMLGAGIWAAGQVNVHR